MVNPDRDRDRTGAPAELFLASRTGMRRGESLGLAGGMSTSTQPGYRSTRLISVAYQVKMSDVKTGTGRRTINLDERTGDDPLRVGRVSEGGPPQAVIVLSVQIGNEVQPRLGFRP